MMPPWLNRSEEGAVLELLVQPRASRNEIVGLVGTALKVRLTSPPVDGAANRLCCDFFAKLLGVSRSEVVLLAGERSRHKRILVRGASVEVLLRLLPPQADAAADAD